VGDNPPFASDTGRQAWRAHFAFEREKFITAALKPGSDRLWLSYVVKRDMNGLAYLGFSTDAVNAFRGGRNVATERTSCIECHGDNLGDGALGLQHQTNYKPSPDRLFDLNVTNEGRFKYVDRPLSKERGAR
jgi:hypothetical protein